MTRAAEGAARREFAERCWHIGDVKVVLIQGNFTAETLIRADGQTKVHAAGILLLDFHKHIAGSGLIRILLLRRHANVVEQIGGFQADLRQFNFAAIHGAPRLKSNHAADDFIARNEIALNLHQASFKALAFGDIDQHVHFSFLA